MVPRRRLIVDVPRQAGEEEEEEEDCKPVWLSIGNGWGITLRIEFQIDADTFFDLAVTAAGSRLLQDLMETASAVGLIALQRMCLQDALFLTKHRHANFVVTKLIQESPTWFCFGICRAFVGKIGKLARHRCGSRVLERIIEHHGFGVDFFFAELVSDAPRIVGNRYGNYVIQNMLENSPQGWRRRCLVSILTTAESNGQAGCYLRCTLSTAFERSTDEYILRLLVPLRPLFQRVECNIENKAAACESQ